MLAAAAEADRDNSFATDAIANQKTGEQTQRNEPASVAVPKKEPTHDADKEAENRTQEGPGEVGDRALLAAPIEIGRLAADDAAGGQLALPLFVLEFDGVVLLIGCDADFAATPRLFEESEVFGRHLPQLFPLRPVEIGGPFEEIPGGKRGSPAPLEGLVKRPFPLRLTREPIRLRAGKETRLQLARRHPRMLVERDLVACPNAS